MAGTSSGWSDLFFEHVAGLMALMHQFEKQNGDIYAEFQDEWLEGIHLVNDVIGEIRRMENPEDYEDEDDEDE